MQKKRKYTFLILFYLFLCHWVVVFRLFTIHQKAHPLYSRFLALPLLVKICVFSNPAKERPAKFDDPFDASSSTVIRDHHNTYVFYPRTSSIAVMMNARVHSDTQICNMQKHYGHNYILINSQTS